MSIILVIIKDKLEGTVENIAALINFANIFTSNANHERIKRPIFQS